MKKIIFMSFFVLTFVGFGGTSAKSAAVTQSAASPELVGSNCYKENYEDAAFAVFFDTNKSVIDDSNCKNNLSQKLNDILKNKCQGIVVVGRASTCGPESINVNLSNDRAKLVLSLTENEYAGKTTWQPASNAENQLCSSNSNDPQYRSALVYITKIQDCAEDPVINDDKDLRQKKCLDATGQTRWDDSLSAGQECVCVDTNKLWDGEKCVILGSGNSERLRTIMISKTIIMTAVKSFESTKAKLSKLSVWKTADGDFNTSRLISDSVAGVVLGTAGGLITSNVIKKNQINGGFDDISCTVGGQVVAGWHDEFRVGIK